jgi:hypothetical protein
MDITWLGYYLCLAFSLGISTSIFMLRPANNIARELRDNKTTRVDDHPIFGYIAWIGMITLISPWVIYSFMTKDYDELVSDIAVGLAE